MGLERNIYVIGDLHGDFDLIDAKLNIGVSLNDEEKDVLFVAGDAGFINSYETKESINKRKQHLNNTPFIIIVVLGNHENYDVIQNLPEIEIFNGKCYKEDGVDVYYAKNGQIFEIDGKKIFTYNGGLSIDKEKWLEYEQQYGVKFWWPQEIDLTDFDDAFKKYLNQKIDYVITHDVPRSVFNKLTSFIPGRFKNNPCLLHDSFEKIYSLKNFEHWYAGHYHPSYPVTIDKLTVLPIGYMIKIK